MDVQKASRFFDRLDIEEFDWENREWVSKAFRGQLKLADTFVAIWNRPTVKRMLYHTPKQSPSSSLIRIPSSGEIFMVARTQVDSANNRSYRSVTGLHNVTAEARVFRRVPSVVEGVRGWAQKTLIHETWADVELRSVNENQNVELTNYGHWFVFMPSNCPVERHDLIEYDGKTYFVYEVYKDSGLVAARSTVSPDERVNFLYYSTLPSVYDPATQKTTNPTIEYHTTGKITPVMSQDIPNSTLLKERISVMLLDSFISYEPKVDDKIQYLGKTYTVESVSRNAVLLEWYLVASL